MRRSSGGAKRERGAGLLRFARNDGKEPSHEENAQGHPPQPQGGKQAYLAQAGSRTSATGLSPKSGRCR